MNGMDALHQLEIWVNLFFQSLGGWLVPPMQAVSFLGTEMFFLLLLPMLYWCVDSRLGLRVAVILVVNNWLNSLLKIGFTSPRPYWVDDRVAGLAAESSFGLPSNHAETAAAIWGYIAFGVKQAWIRAVCLALIFLIGVSRLVLGVHFLSDVLAGWLIGGVLLLLVWNLEKPIGAWLARLSRSRSLAIGAAAAAFVTLSVLLVRAAVGEFPLPVDWQARALAATGEAIDPLNVETGWTIGGLALGLWWGADWLSRRGGMRADGSLLQRALRYPLGLIGIMILYFGLKMIFPDQGDLLSYSLRFVRYALLGAWVAAGAPWLFRKANLLVQ